MTINLHPVRKGGLRPNDPSAPRLMLRRTGAVRALPSHPLAASLFEGVDLGLDLNDRFGTCVPTGFDNFRRMVTRLLTGTSVEASIDDIIRWYRTQNPSFDPYTPGGVQDQGMVIQRFLAYLVREGVILGFAGIDPADDEMLKAADYLAMGPINGAVLTEAQVGRQYDAGFWDYVQGDPEVGGHCFVTGAYSSGPVEETCATWGKKVGMSAAFLDLQRSEAWAVILPEHVSHPGFRAAFDLAAFAAAYTSITGRRFPVTTPGPPPFFRGSLLGRVIAWLRSLIGTR